ncbi:hypothetical protein HDU85_006586 [Gaertneriomyces sp. JEL0708]|nr:hypothetical protein HDU85_006586 [Gaertneriomyces sp. JEL0708]
MVALGDMCAQLVESRGYLGLFGPAIDSMAADEIPAPRQATPFHVTLFSKDELKSRKSEIDQLNISTVVVAIPVDLGLGKRGDVYFKVLWWPQGNDLRSSAGLPAKDFHITLSAADKHDVDKGCSSLIRHRKLSEVQISTISKSLLQAKHVDQALLQLLAKHSPTMSDTSFDIVRRTLARQDLSSWDFTTAYLASHPQSIAAHVRFADEVLKSASSRTSPEMRHAGIPNCSKLAMMHYAKAAELAEGKTLAYCITGIVKCMSTTECGPVFTEDELHLLRSAKHPIPDTAAFVNVSIARDIASAYGQRADENAVASRLTSFLALDSRERMHVRRLSSAPDVTYKLPRFFRWLVPFTLAVMSTPKRQDDIAVLREKFNIHLIVTLTEETPLPREWFGSDDKLNSGNYCKNVFLPVGNYKAPTVAQVDYFIDLMTALPEGQAALVHCGGGKGRAGTFAACYLCACGFSKQRRDYPLLSSAEAIELVRYMRPGSIETEEQEKFVAQYVSHLYRRLSQPPVVIAEPSAGLELYGRFESNVRLIICCGLPGSGKSTFAARLRDTLGFVVVSQDDMGTKDACVTAFNNEWKHGRRIIVDRCNPTPDARAQWSDLAWHPGNALCVFFDYASALCVQRADSRPSHPTLTQGRARNAVVSFAKQLVAPSLEKERKVFSCIARVGSIRAAEELWRRLGVPSQSTPAITTPSTAVATSRTVTPTIHVYKFPRTRHLYNLGAASRDDLVLHSADAAQFLSTADGSTITIEEKVDGANLGISIDETSMSFRVQNRSHYVNAKSHEQFRKLDKWLLDHSEDLFKVLRPWDSEDTAGSSATVSRAKLILYGEWMYARHSIHYQHLPSLFLVFDLYNTRTQKFVGRAELTKLLRATSLHQVPSISVPAPLSEQTLKNLVLTHPSAYYPGVVEGVYLRKDRNGALLDRAKMVRPDFIAGNDHWNKGGVVRNCLKYEAGE